MFAIVIQLGAILCLPIFFRRRIASFFATFPHGRRGDRTVLTHPLTLTAIAFVCTAGPSFLLKKVIGKNLENLVLMGAALVIGGIVMWVVDAIYGSHKGGTFEGAAAEEVEEMGLGAAVWIGLCQNLSAVFPGTSRSMVTIAAGQISGFSRTAALEFSFLLSIPTMIAATGYDLLKYLHPGHMEGAAPPAHIDAHGWVVLAIGFLVSFVVAYVVVAWFMNWVRNRGFTPFAIYRILAGTGVLVWALSAR
jgi:undecaprenyl-diphosphatase